MLTSSIYIDQEEGGEEEGEDSCGKFYLPSLYFEGSLVLMIPGKVVWRMQAQFWVLFMSLLVFLVLFLYSEQRLCVSASSLPCSIMSKCMFSSFSAHRPFISHSLSFFQLHLQYNYTKDQLWIHLFYLSYEWVDNRTSRRNILAYVGWRWYCPGWWDQRRYM